MQDHRFTGEIKHVVMDLSGELTKNHEATLKHIMAKQEVDLRQGASPCAA